MKKNKKAAKNFESIRLYSISALKFLDMQFTLVYIKIIFHKHRTTLFTPLLECLKCMTARLEL